MDKIRWLKYQATSSGSGHAPMYEEIPSNSELVKLGFGKLKDYIKDRLDNISDEYNWSEHFRGINYCVVTSLKPPAAIMLAHKEKMKLQQHLDIVAESKKIVAKHKEKIAYLEKMFKNVPDKIPFGKEPKGFLVKYFNPSYSRAYWKNAIWLKGEQGWEVYREQDEYDKKTIERLKKERSDG